MSEEIGAIYNSILQQVMLLEKSKKELSRQILLNKDHDKRLDQVYKFLVCEYNKHELLEQAAVIALNNQETAIISHLKSMYEPIESSELIDKIRKEMNYGQQFMSLVKKSKSKRGNISFTERRMVQEIVKYVLAQCRIYAQLNI